MNSLHILAFLGDFLEHDDLNPSTMSKSQSMKSTDCVGARKKDS